MWLVVRRQPMRRIVVQDPFFIVGNNLMKIILAVNISRRQPCKAFYGQWVVVQLTS